MSIEEISDILYDRLDYTYCDNCRSRLELEETRCDECHRKYMGWQISREECDKLAKKILELAKK